MAANRIGRTEMIARGLAHMLKRHSAASGDQQGRPASASGASIEVPKGGGAARYFAGLYGAGQPVVKVRGQFFDGERLVCVYEIKRSGESGVARMWGGFMDDLGIQANDVRDLAVDLADFIKRTAAR